MFEPSKGGSSPLASAFLQNRATQPTAAQPTAAPGAQMPLITQPVQAPMDFGSMAPRPMPQAAPQQSMRNPFLNTADLMNSGNIMRARAWAAQNNRPDPYQYMSGVSMINRRGGSNK